MRRERLRTHTARVGAWRRTIERPIYMIDAQPGQTNAWDERSGLFRGEFGSQIPAQNALGLGGKRFEIDAQNSAFFEADVNGFGAEQIGGEFIEEGIVADEHERVFVAVSADLAPNIFDR